MAASDLISLLQRLVAVPSINPELTTDPALGGESRMADFLSTLLEQKGFRVQRIERTPGRPNVVGRLGSDSPRRRFMFESHLDTQSIQGMTVSPFEGLVRDGKVFGRGACDMKGPMAAALHALTPGVLAKLLSADAQLIFVGAMGEERGNRGAEELVRDGWGADEAIVLEPTNLNIVHAHKGAFWADVETRGLAAHGSNPEKGVSAIVGMSQFIARVLSDIEVEQRGHRHPTLGGPTVNFGVIRGGHSTNIVPDQCVVEIDRRVLPGEIGAEIRARWARTLEELRASGQIVSSEIRVIKDSPPFETKPSSPLIERLAASCRTIGAGGGVEGAAWYSDAGMFSNTCAEIAVFGPGKIEQAHTADEYIEIESLERGSQILRDFLSKLAEDVAR